MKNIFNVDPKLSLDRERGLRARISYEVGPPRQIGLTARYSFGGHAAPPSTSTSTSTAAATAAAAGSVSATFSSPAATTTADGKGRARQLTDKSGL